MELGLPGTKQMKRKRETLMMAIVSSVPQNQNLMKSPKIQRNPNRITKRKKAQAILKKAKVLAKKDCLGTSWSRKQNERTGKR